jgi:hypothetical protein
MLCLIVSTAMAGILFGWFGDTINAFTQIIMLIIFWSVVRSDNTIAELRRSIALYERSLEVEKSLRENAVANVGCLTKVLSNKNKHIQRLNDRLQGEILDLAMEG